MTHGEQGELNDIHVVIVKSPLYLTKNLLGGQLPLVLWHWPVGLLSPKEKEKERKKRYSCGN